MKSKRLRKVNLMKTQFTLQKDETYGFALNTGVKFDKIQIYVQINGETVNPLEKATSKPLETKQTEFGEAVCLCCERNYRGVRLVTEFQTYTDKLFVSLEIENQTQEKVVLGKCSLLDGYNQGVIELGEINDLRVLCRDGWGYKNAVVDLSKDTPFPPTQWGEENPNAPKRHRTVVTGDIYNLKTEICLNTSFLSFDRANAVVYYSAEGGKLQMEAVCDFAGFSLLPGNMQKSEILRIASATSYNTCMQSWCDDVVKYYKPIFKERAGLGVLGETWCSGLTSDYAYQEMVLRNAKAVFERLKGFGVKYFWVSISNLKDRVPGNWLNCEYKQIPGGVEGLAKDLRYFDMTLGLWIAPFWIPDKFNNQAEEQKGQFLKKADKPIVDWVYWCRGISGKQPFENRLNFYCRDGSSKAAEEYVRKVFTAYKEVGVGYYMIDFMHCSSGSLYGPFAYDEYEDKSKIAGPETYRNLLKIIRETAGEDTYIVSSTAPTFINVGYVDGSRTGPDIGEGRAALPVYSNYPATFNLHNTEMLKTSCMNFAAVYHLNGKLYHCDSFNVVTVDKPIPVSEAQITVSLAALFESPMMIGDPVFSLSEERLKLLKKALPQNKVSETAIPLDLFETKLGDCPNMYFLPIERRWGKYGVLGLLNITNKTKEYAIDLQKLGFDEETVMYDFWNERFLGVEKGAQTFEVAPYSIRVIRLTPFENRPQLIGTDMHVLQGAVEVVHTDFEEDTLTVACQRPIGESGVITILAPSNYLPQKYEGFHVAKVVGTELCVISKEIKFDIPTVSVVIPFKNTAEKGSDGKNDII